MDRPLVHNRSGLVHGRRFLNSSTTTDTFGGKIQAPGPGSSNRPTAVTRPPKVTSLAISSSASVATLVAAISPAAPVSNPILFIPTSTYTGQALLTAACAVPVYTAVQQSDGSYIAAPVVGCADQNAQCCPSISQNSSAPAAPTASVIPLSEASPAIVSALNADPLILCPADYTSTARSCCPV
jgi:hypothetical protein